MHVICVCAALTTHPEAVNSPFAYDDESAVFWYTEGTSLALLTGPKFWPVIVTTSCDAFVLIKSDPLRLVITGAVYDVVSLDADDC